VTYNFGGQKVTFTGDHVTISMGHHSYHVSWRVYMVTGAHLKQMHLTNISYRRIDTKYQNSAILRENNSYISLAEIFTFGTAMDASIAVKNLMKVNETYEIAFHMVSENHHSKFQLNGNYPMMDSLNENSMIPETGDAMIPSGDWSLTMGHVKVNWQDEMSIFHVGSVSTNPLSSSLILPFGPITLMGNETYSIDPVMTPERLPGGGGGGEAYAPNSATFYIYKSNGDTAGTYTLTSYMGTECPYTQDLAPHENFAVDFGTGLSYPNSIGTWSISQKVSYGFSSGGYGGQLYIGYAESANQNPVNNVLEDGIANYIFSIVSAAVGFPIPDPLSFIELSSDNHQSTLPYSTSEMGEVISSGCVPAEYCPIWQSANPFSSSYGKIAYMFGIHTNSDYFNVGSLDAGVTAQFYIYYIVSVTLIGGSYLNPSYYASPASTLATAFNLYYS